MSDKSSGLERGKKVIRDARRRSAMQTALSYFQFVCLYSVSNKKGDVSLARFVLQCINDVFVTPFKGTITLTFGDVAESHVGMQHIGTMASQGFRYAELSQARRFFEERGCEVHIIHLNKFLPSSDAFDIPERLEHLRVAKEDGDYQAWVLVVRNALNALTSDPNGKNLLAEMLMFDWDTKLYNTKRGVVQNKLARHNLNFSDQKQVANFEIGHGTTIPWIEVPLLRILKQKLTLPFGNAAQDLQCEGNLYYERGKTGLSFHGDTERRKVIGVRLGNPLNISWVWYYNDEPGGKSVQISLNPGDMYCMSEKAVGTDWRPNLALGIRKKRYVLRHAAGAPSYMKTAAKPIKSDKLHIRNQRVWEENPMVTIGDVWYKADKKKSWDEAGVRQP